MKVLVTGASGHVGAHLVRALWRRNFDVTAFVRPTSRSRVLSRDEWGRLTLTYGDLIDAESVFEAVKRTQPDIIHHLGAQSYVRASWDLKEATANINGDGTLHVLQAAARYAPNAIVHICGSSEEYGLVGVDEVPIKESNPLRPLSPYGVSKVTADMHAYQFYRSTGLRVVRTRGFNHAGPGRDSRFAEGSWCKQVAEIEAGLHEPVLKHGDLSAVRDYTDSRDMAEAYVQAVLTGEPGEVYNICSGKEASWKMCDVLTMILSKSPVTIRTEVDQGRLRPSDVPLLIGDCSKFTAITGWSPKIPFKQTLGDLLDWWRGQIRA